MWKGVFDLERKAFNEESKVKPEIKKCKKHDIMPQWRDVPLDPYQHINSLFPREPKKELYCWICEDELENNKILPTINEWNRRQEK